MKLISQGFWHSGLREAFRKFVRSHYDVFGKCSVCKHNQEGVCLPIKDAFLGHRIYMYLQKA